MSTIDREQRRRHAVIDFAHTLVMAALNRLLHARDSVFVDASMADVTDSLKQAERAGVELPLVLQIDDNRLCFEGRPLDGPSLQARRLLDHCIERKVAMLSFADGLDAAEANRLFDLLLLPQNVDAFARSHRESVMVACGIKHVHVSLSDPAAPDDRSSSLDGGGDAVARYQRLANALHDNHRLAYRDSELAIDLAETAIEDSLSDIEAPSMLLSLSMQDDVDRFTVGHSVRVALLALQVARVCGANREQLVHIGSAALLHDIGKSKVPQEILYKQGRLDEDEWLWIMQHPRLGAELLIEQHDNVDPRTIGAAFCHHMGANGSGYPSPVVPVAPSATSKLIRVCDVFEALTAVRPYKQAMTPMEAFGLMFRSEGQFDANWLRTFARAIGVFPNGTRVRLVDGNEALVVGQGADVRRPRVRLLSGPDGEALPAGHPELLDIGTEFEGSPLAIGSVLLPARSQLVPQFEDPELVGPTVHTACSHGHPHDH